MANEPNSYPQVYLDVVKNQDIAKNITKMLGSRNTKDLNDQEATVIQSSDSEDEGEDLYEEDEVDHNKSTKKEAHDDMFVKDVESDEDNDSVFQKSRKMQKFLLYLLTQ